jgi:hypothetical protein
LVRTDLLTVGKKPRDILIVRSLGVDPSYRRRGVGAALLNRCVEFGQERLAAKIQVPLLEETPASVGLLEKGGFRSVMPKVYELAIEDFPVTEAEAAVELKKDGRLLSPEEKQANFLQSCYPEEEFSPEEIEIFFQFLPQIVHMNESSFHPRTKNRLQDYVAILQKYVLGPQSAKDTIAGTHFNSQNALIVWQKGFSQAIARAIEPTQLKILIDNLAAQARQADPKA